MYTIGQVAKRFSLSRSTLLYYDSIGLLTPSGRSESNYRLYSQADLQRMEKIAVYREAGLPLEAIAGLLDSHGDGLHKALDERLLAINSEILALRNQQQVILRLLETSPLVKHSRSLNKDAWVRLLQAAGLDEAGMLKWHVEFERMSPAAHQDFLESLGISAPEIESIRAWSKKGQ